MYIPHNIRFDTPKKVGAGLVEGRLKVVVDEMPLEEDNALRGIDNFGLGGTNAHVSLKRTSKRKVDSKDDPSRLGCVSGRTEEAHTMNVKYTELLHEVFGKGVQTHLYGGFTVATPLGAILNSFALGPEREKSLYVVFGELGNREEIGRQLVALPVFRDSIPDIRTFNGQGCWHYRDHPQMVSVILGGPGGIVMELADWPVLRGASKLVLTSRNGRQWHRIRDAKRDGSGRTRSTADLRLPARPGYPARPERCRRRVRLGGGAGTGIATFGEYRGHDSLRCGQTFVMNGCRGVFQILP